METEYVDCPLYGTKRPISAVLSDLAAQEGADGEPYDQMQEASEYIDRLEALLKKVGDSPAGKIVLAEILRLEKK